MRPDEPSPEWQDEIERAIQAMFREAARVGVDWSAVAGALRSAAPDAFAALDAEPDEMALGLDAPAALDILRRLPDAAGTTAFLHALAGESSGADPQAT